MGDCLNKSRWKYVAFLLSNPSNWKFSRLSEAQGADAVDVMRKFGRQKRRRRLSHKEHQISEAKGT